MKRHIRTPVLRWTALAVLAAWGCASHAVGLGGVRVQSGLGQPLRASIALLGADSGDVTGACIKSKVETVDGAFILAPQIALSRAAASGTITISSRLPINEPAVMIRVEIGCSTSIHRDYQILLDPPVILAAMMGGRAVAALVAPVETVSKESFPAISPGADQNVPVDVSVQKNAIKQYSTVSSTERATRAVRQKTERSIILKGRPASHDVLKLSGDDTDTIFQLKLSGILSEVNKAPVQPATEEMRLAQARFAAILHGEDPTSLAEGQVKGARAQIQTLRTEFEQFKRQNASDRAALAELRNTPGASTWIAGLGGLLTLSFLVIAWLAWRLRTSRQGDQPIWWENGPDAEGNKLNPDSFQAEREGEVIVSGQLEALASANNAEVKHHLNSRPDIKVQTQAENRNVDLPLLEDSNSIAGFFSASGYDPMSGNGRSRDKVNEFKVEEISDVTQEAEFWISLNDPQRAIEILEQQSDADHPESPVPWLYLLDLYREVKNKEKHDALRERFIRLFNANIAKYGESIQTTQPQIIEEFPHLMSKICALWNKDGIVEFLESLLIDDRDGERAGFDLSVYREILLLISIAHELEGLRRLDEAAVLDRVPGTQTMQEILGLPDTEAKSGLIPRPDGSIDFEAIDFNIDIDSNRSK
jgi:pilus assembly protein FimV